MGETSVSLAIRERLGVEPGVLIWRNNSGKLPDAGGRWITFGLGAGSADLIGLDRGRFFALEVKSARGRLSTEQVAWHRAVRAAGGFVSVVRSVDDAVAALARCRAGSLE